MIKELRLIPDEHNPPLSRGTIPFIYESHGARGLRTLRERYKLDRVTAEADNDWDEIRLLKNWLSARWDHGFHNTTNGGSRTGLEYLSRADRGESFTCAVFAYTLVEILTAKGIPARSLTISRSPSDFIGPEDEVGHCVCEAWSNHFRKWVALDADAGAHYEKDGTPLSALEVRDVWLGGNWREISFIRSPKYPAIRYDTFHGPRRQITRGLRAFRRHNVVDFYEHLIYHMSNRHHGSQERPPLLMWYDRAHPPRLVRHNLAVPIDGYAVTCRREDIEYSLNSVFLRAICRPLRHSKPSRHLIVYPETETPWFSHYQVRTKMGLWRTAKVPIPWTLSKGDNIISVRSVNAFGRKGPVSSLTARMH